MYRLILLFLLAGTLASCRTTSSVRNESKTHSVDAGEMVSVEQDRVWERLEQEAMSLLLSEMLSSARQMQEQRDTEQVQEVVTTTTDSLGNSIRTEQRTVNRTSSMQSSAATMQWQQGQQLRVESLLKQVDSLRQAVDKRWHFAESDSTTKNVQKESQPALFPGSWKAWVALLLFMLANWYCYKNRGKWV